MSHIDFSKNYQRLFHFDGWYFLANDAWMAFYRNFDALVTAINDDCYTWLPKSSLDACLDEGAAFFANNREFEAYYDAHVHFLDSLKDTFGSEIQRHETLTVENVRGYLELCRKQLSFFYRTDFLFTDKAFTLSESNPDIKKNLLKNYALKERSRVEIFNDGWFSEYSQVRQVLKKLSRQFGVPVKDLEAYGIEDIYRLFDGGVLDKKIIMDRKAARIMCAENMTVHLYIGSQIKDEIVELLQRTGEVVATKEQTLTGIPASKGKVVGKVKIIISDPKTFDSIGTEMRKMRKGDILVAETTSPEFMPACKKAAAILANQGGLLSHAAVVSRELGIPCIVGLRYATKALKDGDRVEVDAERGIVTVLSRS